MMHRQRIERPVGIGQQLDSSIFSDKNGHLRACLAAECGGLGGGENLLGMLNEMADAVLIGKMKTAII